jgi:hypothetical protein
MSYLGNGWPLAASGGWSAILAANSEACLRDPSSQLAALGKSTLSQAVENM